MTTISRSIPLTWEHRILFTRGVFRPENPLLATTLSPQNKTGARRVFFVLDSGLVERDAALPQEISLYAQAHTDAMQLAGDPLCVQGGEACKNQWDFVHQLWEQINERNLDRHSYVIAIGGGAILDMAGFAAATAHRGVRHLRFPTTTLSQGDGGVGVKNSVNYFGKKNWVGTFSVPFAVVNDFDFLRHLAPRDLRSGLIEGIKVALIRDRVFYERIEALAPRLAHLEQAAVEEVIQKSAENHVDHIATSGDPFELGSARPLDFGHWSAHKLEQVTHFNVSHGEAVAIGMALDLLYSVRIGLLDRCIAERIVALIESIGFSTFHPALMIAGKSGQPVLLEGLQEFREHLGGQLTITLVPEIGRKLEVHEMDSALILESVLELQQRAAAPPASPSI